MKTLLSLITVASIALPMTAQAYFIDDFDYTRRSTAPQYIQDPSLDFLPGWPDWIGRLNLFSQYIYGKQFQYLNQTQQLYVEKLSKNWPDWIGVPSFLRR